METFDGANYSGSQLDVGRQQMELPFSDQPSRFVRVVAELLRRANASPGSHRDLFYVLKDRILCRYGHRCGFDYQEIRRYCWSCEGTGGLREPGGCYRCGGSGVIQLVHVQLQRWSIAGKIFHKPVGRVAPMYGRATIHGFVKHAHEPSGFECFAWLCLLFDRSMLRTILSTPYRSAEEHVRGPFSLLHLLYCCYCRVLRRIKHAMKRAAMERSINRSDDDVPF